MTFKDCLVPFFENEKGSSGIEYALIAGVASAPW